MDGSGRPREGASETEVNEYLRKLCSDVTLCSPKEGFFNHYVEQIDAQVSENFLNKFGKIRSDEERLLTTWGVKPIHTLKVQNFFRGKSMEVSEGRRAEGNKAFQMKKNQQALVLYSQAVMRAPHDYGDCLALALANRAAVHFHMNQYQLCLTDIQLAIEANYPSNLMYKVLDRRGQCHLELGQYSHAFQAFTAAARALADAALDKKKLESWQKDLDAKIHQCHNKEDADQPPPAKGSRATVFGGPNPALPNASNAISLQVSPDEGRYAVVTCAVPAGQVLMAERPYAAVLMENKSGTHCHHCYNRLVSAVPCRWCSGVAFCSPGCRDMALATYHRWECRFQDLLKGSGISLNCYLALRVVTQHGLNFFKKVLEVFSHCPYRRQLRHRLRVPYSLPTASSPHRPNDYMSLYHLADLEEQRSPKDFFQRSLMAAFLLKLLQRADFFGKWDNEGAPDKDLTDDEVLVGGLLLRHLQVIQFNAHELSGMSFAGGENNFRETKSVFLGLAVYPTVSYCNHSCFPAVTRYFEGDRMVIVSLRPLRPGDVVAENYGPIFTHKPLQERRRKLLSRYWFKCMCEACEGDWPIYDNMSNVRMLRCQTCRSPLPPRNQNQSHVKCLECGASCNVVAAFKMVDQAEKLYEAGRKHMDEGHREGAIESFTRFVDTVSEVLVPPVREMHLALQSLRLLIASRGTIHAYDVPGRK